MLLFVQNTMSWALEFHRPKGSQSHITDHHILHDVDIGANAFHNYNPLSAIAYNASLQSTLPDRPNVGQFSSVNTGEGKTMQEMIEAYSETEDKWDNVENVRISNKSYSKALNKYNEQEASKIQKDLNL